jgi:uncharacterized membrane protein
MRALKWAMSAACLVLGPVLVGPSEAQTDTFTLRVCNNSEDPAMLAIIHRLGVNDRRFVVKGWFSLEPGCSEASEIPKGYFYFFAFVPGKEAYWGGDRANTCVSNGGNFERVATPNYSCRDGEVLVPFAEIWVTQDVHTINLD